MRMNGANHSEETLREAEAFARSLIEGRLRVTQEGKVDLFSDGPYLVDVLPLTLPIRIPAPVPREKRKAEELVQLVDTEADCGLASHQWVKPESDGAGMRSSCVRCGSEILTTLQGDAVEVMGDLLRQIPKLKTRGV